jgi:hypothetical protein
MTFPYIYVLYPELVNLLHFSPFYIIPLCTVISKGLKILLNFSIVLFLIFKIYSFIHMCIYCLGHFCPPPPTSPLFPTTPLTSISILLIDSWNLVP